MILFGDSLFGVPLNEFLSRYGGEFFRGFNLDLVLSATVSGVGRPGERRLWPRDPEELPKHRRERSVIGGVPEAHPLYFLAEMHFSRPRSRNNSPEAGNSLWYRKARPP
jgi:hypothetical protein